MSSKRRTQNGVINVKAFEKLLTPSEEIPESETDLDTSALNSSPQNDHMEEEEEEEEEEEYEDEDDEASEYNLSESLQYRLASKDKAVISLSNDTKFFFKGQLQIKVLKGKLEILGHFITNKDKKFQHVYSPKGYSLLYCHGFQDDTEADVTKLSSDLVREGLSHDDSEAITGDCVFVARRLQEPWSKFLTEQLRQNNKINLLHRDNRQLQEEAQNGDVDSITILERALDVNLIHPEASSHNSRLLQVGEDWELALQSVLWSRNNNVVPRMLVAGGKGVGKSTFVRWLTNRLLSSSPVVLVDLDPGQTEVTTPGYLSVSLITEPLLGPNFTHVARIKPSFSVYLGDVSVQNCPDRNIKIIHDLWEYVRANLSGYPVVVNTMGWCNGMGLLMLVDTIRMLEPTTVVQLKSRYQRKNFPFSLTPEAVGGCREGWRSVKKSLSYNLLEFLAVPESTTAQDMRSRDNWGLPEPRLLRELVLLAMLGRTDWPHWPVYTISLSCLALSATNTKLQPGSLLAACNLALVDLCRVEDRHVSRPRDQPHLYGVVRRPLRTPSLGLGLVRNIDTSRHLVHLATPVPPDQLQTVNCLLLGEVRLPTSVLTNNENSPYLAQQSHNPLDTNWQRYHKPRGHN